MAKISFELSFNYDEEELQQFLVDNNLKWISNNHNFGYLRVGDAIKCSTGQVARIVSRFANRENLSDDFIIANKNMSEEEMCKCFLPSQYTQLTLF